jgi:hypothetical protein
MADKYCFLNVGCADCMVMHLGTKVVMVDCHQGGQYPRGHSAPESVPVLREGYLD